jgi:16S rRNA (guanine527-N7)-methyltransferase
VRAGREAVETHLADSLAGLEVESLRHASSIADVGAGAGFPGLALAAARPDARVDLIESAGRKADVIARLIASASLRNAQPIRARVEEWAAGPGAAAYDAATVRAVGPLAVLVEYAAPLLRSGGVLVAWKGTRDGAEERAGRAASALVGLELVETLPVHPYEASKDRNLYVYSKVSDTPRRFPRRPGMATKRPLAR